MATVTEVENEIRESGMPEEAIEQMRIARQKIVSACNSCMIKAEENGLISAETYVFHMDRGPERGLYKDYPVIPTSDKSLNKEGFFSSFMSSDQDAFMKSFIATLEKPRNKGEYRSSKPLSLQQLILYETPKILVTDLFKPDNGKPVFDFWGHIKKRDGVSFAYLTQAYCAWLYGEMLKNKPELLEITNVTVKDLENYYLRIWDSNLFSYYLLYFDTMFGKSNSYPHPLLVQTVYAREMLRIATGDDVQTDGLIDNFENDMGARMFAMTRIPAIGTFILHVIQNKIAKKV